MDKYLDKYYVWAGTELIMDKYHVWAGTELIMDKYLDKYHVWAGTELIMDKYLDKYHVWAGTELIMDKYHVWAGRELIMDKYLDQPTSMIKKRHVTDTGPTDRPFRKVIIFRYRQNLPIIYRYPLMIKIYPLMGANPVNI